MNKKIVKLGKLKYKYIIYVTKNCRKQLYNIFKLV